MKGEMRKLFLVFNTFIFVHRFWHCTHPQDNQAFLPFLPTYGCNESWSFSDNMIFQIIVSVKKGTTKKFGGQRFFKNFHWFWNKIHRTLETIKLLHDSRELNVCCRLMHDRILDWFFLQREQLKATVYWDILELNVSSQIDYVESELGLLFFINTTLCFTALQQLHRQNLRLWFKNTMIGRNEPTAWPSKSQDITLQNCIL